jgi:hypothetical protein
MLLTEHLEHLRVDGHAVHEHALAKVRPGRDARVA